MGSRSPSPSGTCICTRSRECPGAWRSTPPQSLPASTEEGAPRRTGAARAGTPEAGAVPSRRRRVTCSHSPSMIPGLTFFQTLHVLPKNGSLPGYDAFPGEGVAIASSERRGDEVSTIGPRLSRWALRVRPITHVRGPASQGSGPGRAMSGRAMNAELGGGIPATAWIGASAGVPAVVRVSSSTWVPSSMLSGSCDADVDVDVDVEACCPRGGPLSPP